MSGRMRIRPFLAAVAAVCGLAASAPPGRPAQAPQDPAAVLPLEKTVSVAADAGWVDTAIDVGPGEELRFTASGQIDLQRGNPEALCGPGGLDLVTVDQPVPNANIGAVIGKVAQLVDRPRRREIRLGDHGRDLRAVPDRSGGDGHRPLQMMAAWPQ